jgi:hypothetical protein
LLDLEFLIFYSRGASQGKVHIQRQSVSPTTTTRISVIFDCLRDWDGALDTPREMGQRRSQGTSTGLALMYLPIRSACGHARRTGPCAGQALDIMRRLQACRQFGERSKQADRTFSIGFGRNRKMRSTALRYSDHPSTRLTQALSRLAGTLAAPMSIYT